jgi:hypothetical protein
MAQIPDPVVISANYQFLFAKFPFGLHELAGANITMLKLMKENRQALGIDAEAEHFDSTISATLRMLQKQTLNLSLKAEDPTGDSMYFSLKLENKAGHKFPSGYPARRAWVEFEVKTTSGQTVFHSGKMNPDYTIAGENTNFEPHHNVISAEDQVQIYEMVPVDIWGDFTNVLERGFMAIKDNRLTPQGFRTDDPVYDTTKIVGLGNDMDFNRFSNQTEGSGADILHFKLPNQQLTGHLNIRARVWYQSLPPKWMDPIFAFSSPEIDAFKTMFESADQSPILISEASLDSIFVSPVSVEQPNLDGMVQIAPTWSIDGLVQVTVQGGVRLQSVEVWDSGGKRLQQVFNPGSPTPLQLPANPGVYLVVANTDRGRVIRKVVKL